MNMLASITMEEDKAKAEAAKRAADQASAIPSPNTKPIPGSEKGGEKKPASKPPCFN